MGWGDDLMSGLGWVAGSEWPDGDPGLMRDLAELWRTAGSQLTDLESDLEAAKNAALAAYPSGQAHDEIAAAFEQLENGYTTAKGTPSVTDENNQSIARLAYLFGQVADGADNTANQIEAGQWMVESSLALLAVEIAAAWLFPPTAPAEEALAVASTRLAIRMFISRVRAEVAEWVESKISSAIIRFILKHVLINTLIGAGQGTAIQMLQIAQGHKKSFDYNELASTTLSAAAAGAVAGPLGHGLGQWLEDKALSPFLEDIIMAKAGGLAGGTAGFGASLGLTFGESLWNNDGNFGKAWSDTVTQAEQFDPRMLTGGVLSGSITGMFKGSITRHFEMSDSWGRGMAAGITPGAPRFSDLPGVGPRGVGDVNPGDGSLPHAALSTDSGLSAGDGRTAGVVGAGDDGAVRPAGAGTDGSGPNVSATQPERPAQVPSSATPEAVSADKSSALPRAQTNGVNASGLDRAAGGASSVGEAGRSPAEPSASASRAGMAGDNRSLGDTNLSRGSSAQTESTSVSQDSGSKIRAGSPGEQPGTSRSGAAEQGRNVRAVALPETHTPRAGAADANSSSAIRRSEPGSAESDPGRSRASATSDGQGKDERSGVEVRSATDDSGRNDSGKPGSTADGTGRDGSGRNGSGDGRGDQPGLVALRKLMSLHPGGDRVHDLERMVGPEGTDHAELIAAAGGRFRQFAEGHAEIAVLLRRLGNGSTALVADTFHSQTDKYGVGGRLLVLENRDGEIIVHEAAAGSEHGFPPDVPHELARTQAIVFDDKGTPLDRVGGRARRWMFAEGAGAAEKSTLGAMLRDHEADLTRDVLSAGAFDRRLPDGVTGRHVVEALDEHAGPADAQRMREQLSQHEFGRDILNRLGEHPVESFRMFEKNSNGRCAVGVLHELRRMHPDAGIRLFGRAIDEYGVHPDELRVATGGRIGLYGDHQKIVDELNRLGRGSSAVVVDSYRGVADDSNHNVGDHAYLLVNTGDRIMVRDSAAGEEHGFPPDEPHELTGYRKAILIDPDGHPAESLPEGERETLAHQVFDRESAGRIGLAVTTEIDTQVRTLLERTEIGRAALESLDAMPVRTRNAVRAARTVLGEFSPTAQRISVYSTGRSVVEQASVLIHEWTHAEAFVDGKTPLEPLAVTRDEYVHALLDEELRCNLRQAQLERELAALGEPTPAPREAVRVYDRERQAALDEGATESQAHRRATEAGIDYLGQERPPDGQTYSETYGRYWDHANAHAQSAPDAGAARSEELSPEAVERMRPELQRRANLHNLRAELAEQLNDAWQAHGLTRNPGQDLRDPVVRKLNEVDEAVAAASVDQLPALHREQHQLRELLDLGDRYTNLSARIDRSTKALHDLAATEIVNKAMITDPRRTRLSGRAFRSSGENPWIMVVAGPAGHDEVLVDPAVAQAIEALPNARAVRTIVEVDRIGTVTLRMPSDLPETPIGHADDVVPWDLAGHATVERLAEIRATLSRTPVGRWAVEVTRGVRVEHTDDPSEQGYDPLTNRLVLDAGLSDQEHMAALVHTAIHAEMARARGTDGSLDQRIRNSSRMFVEEMLDEQRRAQAAEIVAAIQLRAASVPVREPEGVREYTETFYRARDAEAERLGFGGGEPIPASVRARLESRAHEAGVEALRPIIEGHLENGRFYRDIYEQQWDDAHGVVPFDQHVLNVLRWEGIQAHSFRSGPEISGVRHAEVVVFGDRSEALRVTYENADFAAAEVLSARIAHMLGLDVAVPVAVGDAVYLPTGLDTLELHRMLDPSGHPPALDLHDALLGIPQGELGDRIGSGTDHQNAWVRNHLGFDLGPAGAEPSDFARTYLNADGTVHDHDMTVSQVGRLREMFRALRPDFEALGHGDWHAVVLRRIDDLEAHARPDDRARSDDPEPFRQRADPGELLLRRRGAVVRPSIWPRERTEDRGVSSVEDTPGVLAQSEPPPRNPQSPEPEENSSSPDSDPNNPPAQPDPGNSSAPPDPGTQTPARTPDLPADIRLRAAFDQLSDNRALSAPELARLLADPRLSRTERRALVTALLDGMDHGYHRDSIDLAVARTRVLRELGVDSGRIRMRPIRFGGRGETNVDHASIRYGRARQYEYTMSGPDARKIAAALDRAIRRGRADALTDPLEALTHALLQGDSARRVPMPSTLRRRDDVVFDEHGHILTDKAAVAAAQQDRIDAARRRADERREEQLARTQQAAADAMRSRVDAERPLRDAIDRVNELEAAARARGESHTSRVDWEELADPRHGELVIADLRNQTMRILLSDPTLQEHNRARHDAYDALDTAFRAHRDAAQHESETVAQLRALAEQGALRTVNATSMPGEPRVGVIDGPARRIAVVLWDDSVSAAEVLAHAARRYPELTGLIGEDRAQPVVLRIAADDQGHLTVLREDDRSVDERLRELALRRETLVESRDNLIDLRDQLAQDLGIPETALDTQEDFGGALRTAREQAGVQNFDDLDTVRQLIEARTRVQELDGRIASLDHEVDALERNPSLRDEQERLLRRWRELTERREAIDEQLTALAGTVHVHDFSGADYERSVLARLREAQERTIRTPASIDNPGTVEHRPNSPAEVAQRRSQIRRLMELVGSIEHLDSERTYLEHRLQELAIDGIGDGVPRAPELARRLLRLDSERAALLEDPRTARLRANRDDLLNRLRRTGIDVSDTDLHADAETVRAMLDARRAEAAGRTDGTRQSTLRMIDDLERTAGELRSVENELGRIDDRTAWVTGRWDQALEQEGAVRVTDFAGVHPRLERDGEQQLIGEVALVEGEHARIVVMGTRRGPDGSVAEFDQVLQRGIETDTRIAGAMLEGAEVEYREMIAGPGGVRGESLPGPGAADRRVYFTDDPVGGHPSLRMVAWRDSGGTWHGVDPIRARWHRSDETNTPEGYHPGDPDWWNGLVYYIDSVALPFYHIPHGEIAEDLLPYNEFAVTGQFDTGNIPDDQLFTPEIGGHINAAQRFPRMFLQAMKLPMVQEYIRSHPEIGDWIKERPWLMRKPPFSTALASYEWHRGDQWDVEPMFPDRHSGENSSDPIRAEIPAQTRALYDRLRNTTPDEFRQERQAAAAREVVTGFHAGLVRLVRGFRPGDPAQSAALHDYIEHATREYAPAFRTEDPAAVGDTLTHVQELLSGQFTDGRVPREMVDRLVDALAPHMRNDFAGGDVIADQWRLLSWRDRQYEMFRADPELADKIVAGLTQHARNERVLAARDVVDRIRRQLIEEIPPGERTHPEFPQRLRRRVDVLLDELRDGDLRNLKYRTVKKFGDLYQAADDGLSRFRRVLEESHTTAIAEPGESLTDAYDRILGDGSQDPAADLTERQLREVTERLLIGDRTDPEYAQVLRERIDQVFGALTDGEVAEFGSRTADAARTVADLGDLVFGDMAGTSRLKRVLDAFVTENRDAMHDIVLQVHNRLMETGGRITDETVDGIAEELEDRMREDYSATTAKWPSLDLTRDQVQQVLDHLMENEHWVHDHLDPDGRMVRRRMSQVADVAEAINRLIDVEPVGDRVIPRLRHPLTADVIMLHDALAEAVYTHEHPFGTWYDANVRAAAEGFDWDENRPPLTGWRERIGFRSDIAELLEPMLATERLERTSVVLDDAARALGLDPQEVLDAMAHDPVRQLLHDVRSAQIGDAGLARADALDDTIRQYRQAERFHGPRAEERRRQAAEALAHAAGEVGLDPQDVYAALARNPVRELVESLRNGQADDTGRARVDVLDAAIRERNEALARLAHATRGAEVESRLHTGRDPLELALPGNRDRLRLPALQDRLERAQDALDSAARRAGVDVLDAMGGGPDYFDRLRAEQPDDAGRSRVDELERAVHEFDSADEDVLRARGVVARSELSAAGRAALGRAPLIEALAPYERALREAEQNLDRAQASVDRQQVVVDQARDRRDRVGELLGLEPDALARLTKRSRIRALIDELTARADAGGPDAPDHLLIRRLAAAAREVVAVRRDLIGARRDLTGAQNRVDELQERLRAETVRFQVAQATAERANSIAAQARRDDMAQRAREQRIPELLRQVDDLAGRAEAVAGTDHQAAVLALQQARTALREAQDALESDLAHERAMLAGVAQDVERGLVDAPHRHRLIQDRMSALEQRLDELRSRGGELADLQARLHERNAIRAVSGLSLLPGDIAQSEHAARPSYSEQSFELAGHSGAEIESAAAVAERNLHAAREVREGLESELAQRRQHLAAAQAAAEAARTRALGSLPIEPDALGELDDPNIVDNAAEAAQRTWQVGRRDPRVAVIDGLRDALRERERARAEVERMETDLERARERERELEQAHAAVLAELAAVPGRDGPAQLNSGEGGSGENGSGEDEPGNAGDSGAGRGGGRPPRSPGSRGAHGDDGQGDPQGHGRRQGPTSDSPWNHMSRIPHPPRFISPAQLPNAPVQAPFFDIPEPQLPSPAPAPPTEPGPSPTPTPGPVGPSGPDEHCGPGEQTGPPGPVGSSGPVGSTGPAGASGPAGSSGSTGDTGPQGGSSGSRSGGSSVIPDLLSDIEQAIGPITDALLADVQQWEHPDQPRPEDEPPSPNNQVPQGDSLPQIDNKDRPQPPGVGHEPWNGPSPWDSRPPRNGHEWIPPHGNSQLPTNDSSRQPLIGPPMPPQASPSAGSRPRRGGQRRDGPADPRHSPPQPRILLQPFDALSGPAVLDLGTGEMYAATNIGPAAGLYGSIGGTPVACYRDRGSLLLRTPGRIFDLDDPATGIYWDRSRSGQQLFQVGVAGVRAFEVRYPAPGTNLDFGLWLRDLHADGGRRVDVFR
ncbi:hypothetical protein [Nocardia alni]|uniref:WXG100-like domain-containing protein n=1 Tax=Nocardia alni TaxID=2815723 RepID=UPI001C235AA5|nr:hypothetical protein [Nocardia alni]